MLEYSWIDSLFVIINLFVLYLLMRKFLFGPVTRMIEKRQALIAEQMADAKAKQAQAAQILDEYDGKLAAAGQQAREMIQNAKRKGELEYQSAMDAVKADSQALIASTQAQLEREREEMIDGVRGEVATLAILAAAKVSAGHISADIDVSLVDAFLDEAGEAP